MGAKLLAPTPALNAASPAGDLSEQPVGGGPAATRESPVGVPGLLYCSDHQPVRLNILAALPPIIRDFSSSERISEWRI